MKTRLLLLLGLLCGTNALQAQELAPAREANRPKVPGILRLNVRERRPISEGSKEFETRERTMDWEVAKTAIIICDMWDGHYCRSAAQRVNVMAPKMNEVLNAARSRGVMIIHAPSGTVEMYADTAYRRRMQQAPTVKPPVQIGKWCDYNPEREAPLPVDVSKSPCDDPIVGVAVKQFSRQHPAIDITGFDGISDSGEEIYNFCEQEGITNIALMGVHTNMCVLGRTFGIRQMTALERNVVLVRDMTDAMYDPREAPYVSHARGTELIIEHIEKYWCPSILSPDLMSVVEGSDGP